MRDLQLNHLRLLSLMAIIASAMLLPFWALYDLRRIIILFEMVSISQAPELERIRVVIGHKTLLLILAPVHPSSLFYFFKGNNS